jgi:hypothetical protein
VRGTQLAVSPSYQLTYSSSPFAASGKWLGQTLRKQFQTALQVGRLIYVTSTASPVSDEDAWYWRQKVVPQATERCGVGCWFDL